MKKEAENLPIDADRIAQALAPVFGKYGIESAVLFGSFARGRQGPRSDLDLILIQRTEKPYFERFDGILRDLYSTIRGRDIDLFIYTPDELDRISHRRFIRQALEEGKVIYECRQGPL
jgi:predicted nucleotidyltransferase